MGGDSVVLLFRVSDVTTQKLRLRASTASACDRRVLGDATAGAKHNAHYSHIHRTHRTHRISSPDPAFGRCQSDWYRRVSRFATPPRGRDVYGPPECPSRYDCPSRPMMCTWFHAPALLDAPAPFVCDRDCERDAI